MKDLNLEVLLVARRIADHAKGEGVLIEQRPPRSICIHMGAVLADAVLQSGLNYQTVVRPRVMTILKKFPNRDRLSTLVELIEQRETASFLNWDHHQKINRFESLVNFLKNKEVEYVEDLRNRLTSNQFGIELQTINGIGPKTVDYMACLVGIDSIAVDRHVRTFAKRLGVKNGDYQYLQNVFCCAADLLELPRREFDAWIWRKEAYTGSPQLGLSL